jgi:hypothetical protein
VDAADITCSLSELSVTATPPRSSDDNEERPAHTHTHTSAAEIKDDMRESNEETQKKTNESGAENDKFPQQANPNNDLQFYRCLSCNQLYW